MKETIYTIPLNEVYDTDCECPLCELQIKLEKEAIDYALGAAMMEPDYRIISNDKGYCNKHFASLVSSTNKLSLALVLDTHLEQIRTKISQYEKDANSLNSSKGGIFKKNNVVSFSDSLCSELDKIEKSCIVCEKTSNTMKRYIDILLFMWENDTDFHNKFNNSKGVCLPHFKSLVQASAKKFNSLKAGEFVSLLIKKQVVELERIQQDIHKFTLKFDYRNADMEWGTAKDAPLRTVEKISGFIL